MKVEIMLEQADLIRVYAGSGKVFVRISNSEIINLKKVRSFDLSFAGTICVELQGGATAYVSRRCVSKLKKMLGM